MPEVAAPLTLDSLLTMSATEETKSPDNVVRLMFSERGGRSFAESTDSIPERPKGMIVLVGPEGGWTDQEIETVREGGWEIVTLGGRILRAETAAIVVIGLLQHRFGDLV